MNNPVGLEVIASSNRQPTPALDLSWSRGQDARWAGDLSTTLTSRTPGATVSFQAVLTSKGVPCHQLKTDDPEASQVGHTMLKIQTAEKTQMKSNWEKSISAGSHSHPESRTPRGEKKTAILPAASQLSMIAGPVLPARANAPVGRKIEAPESHTEATSNVLPISRRDQRSNGNYEIGSRIENPAADAPSTPTMPGDRGALKTAAAEPGKEHEDSSKPAAMALGDSDRGLSEEQIAQSDDGRGDARGILVVEPYPGDKGSSEISAAVPHDGAGSFSEKGTADPCKVRTASPVANPNEIAAYSEEKGLSSDSAIDSNGLSISGLNASNEDDAQNRSLRGEQSPGRVDQFSRHVHSQWSTPQDGSPSQRPMDPAGAVSTASSPDPVSVKNTIVPGPRVSMLFPVDSFGFGKPASPVEHATWANSVGDRASRLHSSPPGLMSQQPSASSIAKEAMGMPINNHAASIASSDASSSRPIPVRFNAQETFAALDAENGGAAPVWIHTGGIKAEAGFKDPTLGWVGVRAQVDAGGVHAAVVPSSAGASQALSGNMTNLSTYLTEHHSPVQTLTMASPESLWGERNTEHSGSPDAGHGNGQEGHQGQEREGGSDAAAFPFGTEAKLGESRDAADSMLVYGGTEGKYISVIA
jgi:hypothetical protein